MRIFAVIVIFLTSCASNPEKYMAEAGQTADVASTVTALAQGGFIEVNPLFYVIWPVKFMMGEMATHQVPQRCREDQKLIAAVGWGAAAWNTALIAGGTAATGGLAAFGLPAALWPLINSGAEKRCENASPRTKEERAALDEKLELDRTLWGL